MSRSVILRRTPVRITAASALAFVVLLGGLSSLASPASAAPSLAAAGISAPQGGTLTIAGNVSISNGCPAGASVQLTSTPASGTANLFTDGLGPKVPRDANGNFKATFVIPTTTPVGTYSIGVVCGSNVVASTETLTVTAGPNSKPSISVSPTSAPAGAAVTITGLVPTSGTVFCPASDTAQLTSDAALFPPDGFGPKVTRDATGNFRTTYTIPAATTAATYSIGIRCGGGNVGVSASLQVTAATTTTTAPATTTTTAAATTAPTATTATTLSPVTTAPPTTAAPSTGKPKKKKSSLRWVALGVFGLVVLVGGGFFLAQRGRGPGAP